VGLAILRRGYHGDARRKCAHNAPKLVSGHGSNTHILNNRSSAFRLGGLFDPLYDGFAIRLSTRPT
jgi:hypothetical protein